MDLSLDYQNYISNYQLLISRRCLSQPILYEQDSLPGRPNLSPHVGSESVSSVESKSESSTGSDFESS
jgi:hypothetical protein